MDSATLGQKYDGIIAECSNIFSKKMKDYGPTWLLFRDESFVDQLWIKAKRIRTLEESNGVNLVGEGREDEYIGIINYAVIMLTRLTNPDIFPSAETVVNDTGAYDSFDADTAARLYTEAFAKVKALMERKNHDYGAAWTQMHIHSVTDQIIIKIFRIKNILANGGKLLISEGIDAQLSDVINYSIFGLIKLRENI